MSEHKSEALPLTIEFEPWAVEKEYFIWNETKTKRTVDRRQWEAFEAGADAVLRGLGLNPDDYRTDFGSLNLPNVRDAISRAEWIDRYRELARNALAANASLTGGSAAKNGDSNER